MKDDIVYEACPVCGGQSIPHQPRFLVPFPETSSRPNSRGFRLDDPPEVPYWVIAKCLECGVHHPVPRPSEAEIESYYASAVDPSDWEMDHYVEIDPKGREAWASVANRLTVLNGGVGRLLEVGCASGWLLKAAREGGWIVKGVEAAPKFQRYATERLGLDVLRGTVRDLPPGDPFDLIWMSDVIEHLHDPVADLKFLKRLLAPGGHVVVTTCNIGSLIARLYGLGWRQIVISHTFYWTKRSLTKALDRAGFKVVHYSEPRYWHPMRRREKTARVREVFKLGARWILINTYARAATRSPAFRNLPSRLTGGRLTHERLDRAIGDQPVLGDVLLVVATAQDLGVVP